MVSLLQLIAILGTLNNLPNVTSEVMSMALYKKKLAQYKEIHNIDSILAIFQNYTSEEDKSQEYFDYYAEQEDKWDKMWLNGTKESVESYPFVVSIQKYNIHHCTGTILSEEWILTAAHCLVQTGYYVQLHNPQKFTVKAGKLDTSGYYFSHVKSLVIHQRFSKKRYTYDIGLVSVYKLFVFSNYIGKVRLAQMTDKSYSKVSSCSVVAYTDVVPGAIAVVFPSSTPHLRKTEVEFISTFMCRKYLSITLLTKLHICSKHGAHMFGTCSGLSGAPLLCEGIQYGITSWGIGCSNENHPAVYTKVEQYKEWIEMAMLNPDSGSTYQIALSKASNLITYHIHFIIFTQTIDIYYFI